MLPDGVTIEQGKPGSDESELLLEGEVDALIHAAAPAAYIDGDPRVVSLFQNAGEVEKDYFTRTGIFPIMHVLAIRRVTAAEHPWLARAVFEAFCLDDVCTISSFVAKFGRLAPRARHRRGS